MPARRRALTATATAVVLAATTAVLAAGAANAAPVPATSNVTVTLGTPAPAGALTPGGGTETFTVTATNNTATAQKFTAEAGGMSAGVLPITAADVTFQATAIGSTPATDGSLNTQDRGLLGAFYPAGGTFGDSFTIPAHATYSWKLSLAATKAWPLNDGDLKFYVMGNDGATYNSHDFTVGNGKTGGPVLQTINGDNTVAPGQPAYEYLNVTNNTGAPLGRDWTDRLTFSPVVPTGSQTFLDQVTLETDVWNGRAYVAVAAGDPLPAPSKDLAPGATTVYRIRVDLVKYAATAAKGQLRLSANDTSKVLTISRDPQTGPHASASASASPTPHSSAATTGPTAPTTALATPATGATLAETGGGSDTSLLVGIALALLAVGSTVILTLKRRTSRR